MEKIKEIKKLKRLYSVTFEGEHERIYITEDTIVKFMLSKGTALEDNQLKEVITFSNYSRGKNLAIYYISFKMRTSAEVRKYLVEHEIPEADIPRIISELEELTFINDKKYAESYLTGKINVGTSGPYNLKQKLIQKGINSELADEKLTELYPEDKQLENATLLAEKLVRTKSARLPLKQLKLKITQSLTQKGFSYNIANQALTSLALEADEENEAELLAAEAEKAYRRFANRYEGYDLKNHITQALGRKGFDWSAISDALKDYDF